MCPACEMTQEWYLPVVSTAAVATKTTNTRQCSSAMANEHSSPQPTPLLQGRPSPFDFQGPCFSLFLRWHSISDFSVSCFSSARGSSPQTSLFHPHSLTEGVSSSFLALNSIDVLMTPTPTFPARAPPPHLHVQWVTLTNRPPHLPLLQPSAP